MFDDRGSSALLQVIGRMKHGQRRVSLERYNRTKRVSRASWMGASRFHELGWLHQSSMVPKNELVCQKMTYDM